METIELTGGVRLRYRVTGPSSPSPVVFVHGLLVNGSLWDATARALAAQGVRAYAPDWPLGAHTIPVPAGAGLSPAALGRLIVDFIQALDLDDVTLVGNDTGGALCQYALDADPSRIGRVVLTNCDAFDQFPPPPFHLLVAALRRRALIRPLMAPMRLVGVRHSPLGFGPLARRPLDPAQTFGWVAPSLGDPGVRRDLARFAAGIAAADLAPVSARLARFSGPGLVVWGTADRFFKLELGRRLADTFAHGRLVEVPESAAFVPHDAPERLAQEIATLRGAPAPAAAAS